MKRYLLSLNLIVVFSLSLSGQITVPETQMTLITKVAADWCPPCGGWGWDLFEEILEDNAEKAIIVAAHYSGNLKTDAAVAFAANFGATSQPRFFVNETDMNANSGNGASVRASVQTMVDNNATVSPIAQSGIQAIYTPDNLATISINTKFFQAAEGEYYLGIYHIKKLTIAPQANQPDDAQHHALLDEEIDPNATGEFGNLLASGSISAEDAFTSSVMLSIDSESFDYENYEVAAIIWKKVGDKFQFVNGNKTDYVLGPNSTHNLSQLDQSLKVWPTIITQDFNVNLSADEIMKNTQISLYNPQGQLIKVLFEGDLVNGQQTFTLKRPDNTPTGIYFLRLNTSEGQVVRRVFFE